MADLIGKDYTPPDIHGKVTGRAKYAEDFRMDGMLYCRLLKSPMPHCRVRSVDASVALAMEEVQVTELVCDEFDSDTSEFDMLLSASRARAAVAKNAATSGKKRAGTSPATTATKRPGTSNSAPTTAN